MSVAMECPAGSDSASVAAAKVALLEKTATLHYSADKVFLGQFGAHEWVDRDKGTARSEPGYLDDPTVPEGSRCPTFASVKLEIDNERWRGERKRLSVFLFPILLMFCAVLSLS